MTARVWAVTTVATAVASLYLGSAPASADDRHVLHRCENVLAHAPKAANSTKALRDTEEIERCRIVVRESVVRDSRMMVDQNGKMVR